MDDAEIEMPEMEPLRPGDVIQSKEQLPIPEITKPSEARPGLAFKDWYPNPEGEGNPIQFPYTVTEDSEIYAVFDELYVINLMAINPEDPESEVASPVMPEQEKIFRNEMLDKPASDPAAEGYEFGGWFLDEECSNPAVFPMQITGETYLYAKFVQISPSVSFKAILTGSLESEAVFDEPYEIAEGEMIQIPEAPVAAGYSFVDWYLDEAHEERMTEAVAAVSGENVLYAWFVESAITVDEDESRVPVTYYADVDDPDDIFYYVKDVESSDKDLYITDRINGDFPTEIGASAIRSKSFEGDVYINVRRINSAAFGRTKFGEQSNEAHSYTFIAEEIVGTGSFNEASIGDELGARGSIDVDFEIGKTGDNAIGELYIGRAATGLVDISIHVGTAGESSMEFQICPELGVTSSPAKAYIKVDETVANSFDGFVPFSAIAKNSKAELTIDIGSAVYGFMGTQAGLFSAAYGSGKLTLNIINAEEYALRNVQFFPSMPRLVGAGSSGKREHNIEINIDKAESDVFYSTSFFPSCAGDFEADVKIEIEAFDEKKPYLGLYDSGFEHTVRQFGAYDIVR